MGLEYRGTLNTTRDGEVCQRWDSQIPHTHNNKPEENPDRGLQENYCRNPDDEPKGPWCYTTDPDIRWEYCDIGFC